MKRFILFALFALVSLASLDLMAGTGFIDDAKGVIEMLSPESGAAILTATAVAAMPGKGDQDRVWAVTKEEFDELSKKHGRLYIIDIIFDETEKYQFIAKRPNRETIQAVAASKDDLSKANDLMINMMIVGGNKAILDDGLVYSRLLAEIGKIFKEGQSSFTKA